MAALYLNQMPIKSAKYELTANLTASYPAEKTVCEVIHRWTVMSGYDKLC